MGEVWSRGVVLMGAAGCGRASLVLDWAGLVVGLRGRRRVGQRVCVRGGRRGRGGGHGGEIGSAACRVSP